MVQTILKSSFNTTTSPKLLSLCRFLLLLSFSLFKASFLSLPCLAQEHQRVEDEWRKPASFARLTRKSAMASVPVGNVSSASDLPRVLIHPTNAYTDVSGDGQRTWTCPFLCVPRTIQYRPKTRQWRVPTRRAGGPLVITSEMAQWANISRSQNFPASCVIRKDEKVCGHQYSFNISAKRNGPVWF